MRSIYIYIYIYIYKIFQTARWSILYSFALFITFDHNFAVFFSDDITKSFIFTGIYSLFQGIKKISCIRIEITQPLSLHVFFSMMSCGVRAVHSDISTLDCRSPFKV